VKFLKYIVLFGLFYFCFVPVLPAQEVKSGLEFYSFEEKQEDRTSLNLDPDEPYSFPDGFSMSFDVCFVKSKWNFGYVFRIIGQNDQHVDFILRETNLIVTYSLGKIIADCALREINLDYNSFIPFKITFDIKNNLVNVSLANEKFSTKAVSIDDFKKGNIIFGKCDYPQLQTSDVPKMIIKNVRINNLKDEPVYFWPLSKHTQTGVYDELKNCFAGAENAKWVLDEHALWKKQIAFDTQNNPQISYDSNEKRIAIADRESFFLYDTYTHTLSKDKLKMGFPHSIYANQMIYNPLNKKYYSYRFKMNKGEEVVSYDPSSKSWENYELEKSYSEYWHHNGIVSYPDSCIYLFGGYGHHKYKDEINKYSFRTQTWEKLHYKGDKVQPRYLSGLGKIDDDHVLIFGGYGSETGSQELSPQNYYNLFVVDIRTLEAKKIWEMNPPPQNGFVVANSLVVDTLNSCFYALCFSQQLYNTAFYLARFSMEKPEYEVLTNGIPFSFHDIYSYVDLFFNEDSNELSAIAFSPVVPDSTSVVSIYSLAYPPMSETGLYQNPEDVKSLSKTFYASIALVLVLLLAATVCIYKIRKKKNPVAEKDTDNEISSEDEKPEHINKKEKKQAIFLFGGFQVKDKNGRDITGEFSPLLVQLFLIILLNTLKEDGKGISSSKLKDVLWFDKSQESALNNRGVLLSKIRQIFEQVGYINVESQNTYWSVTFGEEMYCDYREALAIMKRLKEKKNRTGKEIKKLIAIVSAGELLPNLQIDWIDPFKADFANELIDLLLDIAAQNSFVFSPQEHIDLADAIFTHDSLNEEALKLKCAALIKMGKNGLAKAVYSSFTKEYSTLFNAKFRYSFEQVIS
jgi:two-component SAPR family response regulator